MNADFCFLNRYPRLSLSFALSFPSLVSWSLPLLFSGGLKPSCIGCGRKSGSKSSSWLGGGKGGRGGRAGSAYGGGCSCCDCCCSSVVLSFSGSPAPAPSVVPREECWEDSKLVRISNMAGPELSTSWSGRSCFRMKSATTNRSAIGSVLSRGMIRGLPVPSDTSFKL